MQNCERADMALPDKCWLIATLIIGMFALPGCGSSGSSAGSSVTAPSPSVEAPSLPSPVSIETFCTEEIPAGITQRELQAPDGVSLNSAWLGSGKTVAVLLHEGDGSGLCGFLFYADFLAQHGIRVAMFDLCNHGQSYCINSPIAEDPGAQVKLVVDAARAEGAERVVLVGASLGASVAVTAARTVNPDGIAALSGSAQEEQSDITVDAPYVTMPALFAYSKADQSDLVAVRNQLKNMPTKEKVFLTYDSGHGYTLLHDLMTGEFTSLATRVEKWVKGS
jgi:dienelactone hydrolase